MATEITPGRTVTYTGGRKRATARLVRYEDDGQPVITFEGVFEFPVPADTIEVYRDVVRTWHLPASGGRVRVATRHPQVGLLDRGTVYAYAGGWRVVDIDGEDLGVHGGDYLDAERVLLDATAALDELVDDEEMDG